MKITKVFIDGSAGTTGLRIYERMKQREDVQLLTLPEERRKDPAARREMLHCCDAAFLCLPDDAAREAAEMAADSNAVLIDTSTAHRTEPGWAYGFPELSPSFADRIRTMRRISVPGCHASGFIALIYPLIEAGILSRDALLSCHSVTGYSGGGKKMIAEYESSSPDPLFSAPRQYGLGQTHKHLKEMQRIPGLASAPIFSPIVSNFYSGMVVTVPIFREMLAPGFEAEDIRRTYAAKYTGPVVQYLPKMDEDGMLSAGALSGNDGMQITVCGGEERILLIARYDNLGKGASGAAIECLNLATGVALQKGLVLTEFAEKQ